MTRALRIALISLCAANLQAIRPVVGMSAERGSLIVSPSEHQKNPLPIRVTASSTPAGLMSVSDLSCTGAFLTPGVAFQTGTAWPVAMRYESGARHYFIYAADQHVYEFPEASLLGCSTAVASLNRASFEGWGGDWGVFTAHGAEIAPSISSDPGQYATAWGLNFDASGRLVLSWAGNYGTVGIHNGFAAATLDNVSHTLATQGCWGISGVPMVQIGTGIVTIPSAFVAANLPAGASLGVGMGWSVSTVGAGISNGPTMYAVVPPANNACSPNTDTFVSGTKLWGYDNNPNGPNCSSDNGRTIGCSPPETPTTPEPVHIAYTNYSLSVYSTDWEPYGGHGFGHFETYGAYAWYDDGVKRGIVLPFTTSEGWLNSTVASSTSTTDFVASSVSTHDGLSVNPKDLIWVQTCTPGVDPGCDLANSDYLTVAQVNTINTSTKAINYTVVSADFGSGNHVPVPGGAFFHGCIYAHGTPSCSRWTMRMQIYDPNDLASVAQGALLPSQVVAADDQEIDQTLITALGSPSSGSGIGQSPAVGTGTAPGSVMADTTARDIIVSIPDVNGASPPFLKAAVVYVLHVNESSPEPLEIGGAVGLFGLLQLAALARRRR